MPGLVCPVERNASEWTVCHGLSLTAVDTLIPKPYIRIL